VARVTEVSSFVKSFLVPFFRSASRGEVACRVLFRHLFCLNSNTTFCGFVFNANGHGLCALCFFDVSLWID